MFAKSNNVELNSNRFLLKILLFRNRLNTCFALIGTSGPQTKCPDYIAVVNGYTGDVLQLTGIPDQGPLSMGPLLKGSGDGSTYLLYSTAGANGSLYMASLKDITSGRKDLVCKVEIV